MSPRREAAPAALVWDWPLRVFHWVLAVCVAAAWATHYAGLEWFPWHRRFGYATLVLVGFRLAWGVVGPRHARFRAFVRGPRAVWHYVRRRDAAPAAGHNPLGGWSVLAMLAALLLQAATGLFANDEIANAGPFYGWVASQTSGRLTGLHHLNSNVVLGLVALHLLAIAWHDLVRGRGLTRSMASGRRAGGEGIEGSRGALALAIVLALAGALALAIRAAPEATILFF